MRPLKLCTALVSVLAVAMAWGCDGLKAQTDCEELKTCPVEAGDGGGGDVVVPPDCDLTKALKDSASCVDDAVGVFVAPSGDDGATGKKSAPVKSIGKGIELAASRGLPRVYVCEGTYEGAAEVRAPVGLYGGLSCAWAYTGAKPKLAPPNGIALRVTKVSGAVLVQDFDVLGSADANAPGDSAIAAFVSESTNVTFRNVTLTAGPGTGGAKGAGRSNYSGTAGAGGLTNTAAAGAGPSCACTDGTTTKGGAGANGMGLGVENGSAMPAVGTGNSGSTAAGSCTSATTGANGVAMGPGGPSASAGTLTATGWDTTVAVQNGANGNPGQGGGGGGARSDLNLGGGGGGCGGCGGAGARSGANGGSSVALLSFNSTVTVEGGKLTSGPGGAAGAGGDGQAGEPGGALGAGVCNGGAGGNGAGGSGGGGGAGGHSAPVAFVGIEPHASGATLTPGTKGAIGGGGAPGAGPGNAGTAGTPGLEGKAQNSLAL